MDKKVLMPKELTAENGAKAALIGEFKERFTAECVTCGGTGMDAYEPNDECEDCRGSGSWVYDVDVTWATIKEIYKKAVELFGKQEKSVTHQVMKTPFDRGKQAYHDGIDPTDNPYPFGSPQSHEWVRGYLVEDSQESGDSGEV